MGMSDLSLLASRKPPFRSHIKRSCKNTAIRCWRTLGDSAEARRRPSQRGVAGPGKFAKRHKIPRASAPEAMEQPGQKHEQISVVYKFGGSSLASAERMREVARIVCSEQDHFPCVVLSAMGKTTNTLLEAGESAISTAAESIPQLPPVRKVKELHRETAIQLEADPDTTAAVERLLEQLEQLLTGISIMQDLTPRAKDSLVSFGERLSTRLFAAYLRSQGVGAKQYDAWDLGFTTTDEFTNADIVYESTLPQIKNVLRRDSDSPRELPIVTGFLGRGKDTKAITTLGRGGSDLSATVIGLALGVPEVQVWKDVDGVLSCDPRLVPEAVPVSTITYEEATELAYFGAQVLHPQAMLPAQRSGGKLCVRVRNSYNRAASGSVITHSRDMEGVLLTSIVLKDNITMLDIVSTRMLGQHGFLSRVFDIFRSKKISVDVVATSEISVSLTLDPSRIWSRDLIDEELSDLIAAFTDRQIADVRCRRGMSIISLICNIERTSELLQRVFMVLAAQNIQVRMMSQGASKTNISLIVDADVAKGAIQAIHQEFFR